MSNVKLAIRVRPFTEKELRSDKDRVPVVNVVDNNTVTITNIKVSVSGAGDSRERTRQYYADYTFDSFCPVTQPSYASQEKVFEAIGQDVIASVSRGCSACVLAYGQSATGKTHTMMGTEAQPGLIPRLCKALYEQQPVDFTISFLEIYNERVHDLLSGEVPLPPCHSLPRRRGNARKDLRVREHPSRGPYVQNLRRVSVQDAEALLTLVAEGARRRRTAATRRNSTSSRSHALLEIATPHATLHLADLAGRYLWFLHLLFEFQSRANSFGQSRRELQPGNLEWTEISVYTYAYGDRRVTPDKWSVSCSLGTIVWIRDNRESSLPPIATIHTYIHFQAIAWTQNGVALGANMTKASWEGCGGGRQKEGSNINKSLVALSNVISALVGGGATRGRFVPYRDSALTWLLKDCFTGGASTFIIATVSPSVACYGESASTLRWAARARQLPTPRAVNCGSQVASRAALQAQFNQLISELTRNHIRYVPETGKILFDDKHWTLQTNEQDLQCTDLSKTANIGNIMNLTRPKPDATNSESTASSVASGSSDVLNTIDKNSTIASEINKEMDKLFGPSLERASSGDDLKVVAPLRHKKRQFRSQEVLPNTESSLSVQSNNLANTLPSQSEAQINDVPNPEKLKVPSITILHENQRAEIVASVTERLYTKLKKKEEAAVTKVESVVDRKIIEPLSELKICTNARQRLMELSQKAIRNKRRIGIPAHTQTRITATRVKDQAIDVQTDLYSYISRNKFSNTFYRDVATETIPMTPRCKEIAVGPTGSLDSTDISTETKRVLYKNSFMMTDIVTKNERQTQTLVVPPPRRRKRVSSSKHVCSKDSRNFNEECSAAPVISINISQVYPVDTETQSSDDNSENITVTNSKSSVATATPDLLTNHSTTDPQNIIDIREDEISVLVNVAENAKYPFIIQGVNEGKYTDHIKHSEEFPDTDDLTLPRVSPNSLKKVNSTEIKNMILGRNENMYPYNIILSPPKQRDTKRIVKFKDTQADQAIAIALETGKENENEDNTKNETETASDLTTSEKDFPVDKEYESIYSDSTESSKVETDSFIWKKGGSRTMGSLKRSNYVPVYKSTKYKTTKARVLKDFLGLESEGNERSFTKDEVSQNVREFSSSDSKGTDNASEYKNRLRKPYYENKPYYNHSTDYNYDDLSEFQIIERKLLDSCGNLEKSVNKYDKYVTNYKGGMQDDCVETTARRPKEYLQHLVQLRREVVKAESENTDSSIDLVRK